MTSESQPDEPAGADTASNAEPEALPATAVALAAKAKDLVAIRDAVVDAAGIAAGLWFSYLFVLLYLLVAAGSVTHRDLLLESPVRLPFLNVDLPLVGFFVLGPLLFLVVHAYVLLHFVLLAGKVGVFDAELRAQIPDLEIRTRLRRQLPSNIFVQFLAGPRETREGIVGLFLRLIAQVSLVIGPVALLVFVQLQFLPYHDEAISRWQRVAVIIDLGLLWTLWPAIAHGKPITEAWRGTPARTISWVALASLIPILLTLSFATFPGEWLEGRFSVTDDKSRFDPAHLAFKLRQALVAGPPDLAARKPTSLWSNRLVLPGLSVMDDAKYDTEAKLVAVRETYSLRGRNLTGAFLTGATLRKVDFTAALLDGAKLDDADLRDAKFGCAVKGDGGSPPQRCTQLVDASLDHANLAGADMVYANLRNAVLDDARFRKAALDHAILAGAWLDDADLEGANLSDVDLRDGSLFRTNLQGATLADASLQGAILKSAHLQGASLNRANLLGADLQSAAMQGASLQAANLQCSDLTSANLQAAFLNRALMDGARLEEADLTGATLEAASLQGAVLKEAKMNAASLAGTLVWRAELTASQTDTSFADALQTTPKKYCNLDDLDLCDWFVSDALQLWTAIEAQISPGPRRDAARNVSTTLIHPGSTFRLDSVTPAGGFWVDGELAGTEVFALRA